MRVALLGCLFLPALGGCAALTNPVAEGVPVRRLPPEFLGKFRDDTQTIPLALLGQKPPAVYRLAAGDTLGVWVESILGDRTQQLPTTTSDLPQFPPVIGYPIVVREDGTISLPLIDPIRVDGMSVIEVENAVRKAYVAKEILKKGNERVIVTLMRRRVYHVLVMRQETGNFSSGPEARTVVSAPLNKLGVAQALDLPAFENDVLNALARSGGLPGLDAYDAVRIERAAMRLDPKGAARYEPGVTPLDPSGRPLPHSLLVPLRVKAGETPNIRQEDVILESGDVVFIEERNLEYFYTGGLLPPGEYILPRDRDLDVVEAISFVKGPLVNGAFGGSNLSGQLIQPGIGQPSPSLLTVLRRLPNGGEVRIRVDLNRALRDPRERIVIQPKDVLILQETPTEAIVRYIDEMVHFNFFWQVIQGKRTNLTNTITVP
jgi:protein involved in polysaccharide export with SLBB domain